MHDSDSPTWPVIFLILMLTAGLRAHAADMATMTAPLKFHPGHYIALNQGDGQAEIRDAKKPGVAGVQKRYTWAELEPDKDHYDFAQVESDLMLAAKLGLQYVLFIEDKSFTDAIPTPPYLRDETVALKGGGWIAKRWDPGTIERFSALMLALGTRLDGHPNFEGIALQESSMGFPEAKAKTYGYTPEVYRDALIKTLKLARQAFPSSQIFWYMNFLEGKNSYLADVAEAIVPSRIAMGGPDVLPDNPGLRRHAYPLYQRFADRLTLFCSIQNVGYAHPHRKEGARSGKYWTMHELFAFARDELHVRYLFWNRKTWRKPPDSFDWTHALPVIRDNPTFNQP